MAPFAGSCLVEGGVELDAFVSVGEASESARRVETFFEALTVYACRFELRSRALETRDGVVERVGRVSWLWADRRSKTCPFLLQVREPTWACVDGHCLRGGAT